MYMYPYRVLILLGCFHGTSPWTDTSPRHSEDVCMYLTTVGTSSAESWGLLSYSLVDASRQRSWCCGLWIVLCADSLGAGLRTLAIGAVSSPPRTQSICRAIGLSKIHTRSET
ncbi:hypothetical protein F5Y03DRAFT_353361 [Xylaria venustula]|nr:hypothetical protein F5Y03DRAFT_353361 [Xylaria venustula]